MAREAEIAHEPDLERESAEVFTDLLDGDLMEEPLFVSWMNGHLNTRPMLKRAFVDLFAETEGFNTLVQRAYKNWCDSQKDRY